MEVSLSGDLGKNVVSHVVVVPSPEFAHVQILHQSMEAKIALNLE